jgi:uncharacterized protein (DUF58 family)
MSELLLDVPILEKLEQLALRRQPRSGRPGSQQYWRTPGGSREFIDHRKFHVGDDLRRINWQAYLRSDTLVVKLYQDDLHVPTRILLDRSRSMLCGSREGEETKLTYAKRLAAALIYIALVRLESTVIQPFSFGLAQPIRYEGGRHKFGSAECYLRELSADEHTDYATMAEEFVRRYPTPGLAIVISDFFGDGECLRPLRSIVDRGHELWLIQLWAAEDRSPSIGSHLRLIDVESHCSLSLNVDDSSIRAYKVAFDRHSEALRTMACSRGGSYLGLSVTTPLLGALFGPMIQSGMVG